MSTQEHAVPSSLAHLLIELAQDAGKRDQFNQDPSAFLQDTNFDAKQITALLSRDPQAVRQAFGLHVGSAGLDAYKEYIRDIVREEIEKSKKRPPKKKPTSKKPAKKKK